MAITIIISNVSDAVACGCSSSLCSVGRCKWIIEVKGDYEWLAREWVRMGRVEVVK